MQNKPNFPAPQMNVSFALTKDYENEIAFWLQKNKPKQSQSKPVLSAVEWANFKGNLAPSGAGQP
jgi:hypothetical protein